MEVFKIKERVAELRNMQGENGMSYGEFANLIGIPKSTVYKAEVGLRDVSKKLKKAIINKLCVNENWLIDGVGDIYDEAKKKKQEIYNTAIKAMDKVMENCKALENTLYFNRYQSNSIIEEFDFYLYFNDLSEEKIRVSPIEPIELVSAFLNYFVQMEKLLTQAIQMIGYLKEFEFGEDFNIERIERNLHITQGKFYENVAYFKDYIKKNDTSSKVIGIIDEIMSLCKPLDYRQQIDIKKTIAKLLK